MEMVCFGNSGNYNLQSGESYGLTYHPILMLVVDGP